MTTSDDLQSKQQPSGPKKTRRRTFKRELLKIIGFVAFACVGLFALNYWINGSPWMVKKEIALVPAGEPLTADELDAYYQAPPAHLDATQLWLKGTANLDAKEFYERGGTLPFVGTGASDQIPPPGQAWADLEAAESFLAEYKTELDLIYQASALGGAARFHCDFQDGIYMELPHAQGLRTAANLMALQAYVNAHRGDAHGAAEAIHAIFRAAKSLEKEPVLITQLLRAAIGETGRTQIESMLVVVSFSREDLLRMQADLRAVDQHDSCYRALIGERVVGLITRENPAQCVDDEVGDATEWFMKIQYREKACYMQYMRRSITLTQYPWLDALDQAKKEKQELDDLSDSTIYSIRHMLTLLMAPVIPAFIRSEASDAAHSRCTDGAIAAELYRRDKGSWPKSLEELVPNYLPEVPSDPFTGDPLLYRLNEKELVIYSVGKDGVDNGGVEERNGNPDIVFRLEFGAPPAGEKQPE